MASDLTHGTLRKAAILVSSLETAAADALLDEMPAHLAAQVRSAVLELAHVDAQEQREILREFREARQGPAESHLEGVELDPGLAERLAAKAGAGDMQTLLATPERTPFHFLQEADAATLARHLEREQPQTMAVVFSHLPPAQAAAVLERLSPANQTAVLDRLANLDATDAETIREIEEQLAAGLREQVQAHQRRAAGRAAIQAILNAAPPLLRRQLSRRWPHGAVATEVDETKARAWALEERAAQKTPASSHDERSPSLVEAIERLNRAQTRAPEKAAPLAAPAAAMLEARVPNAAAMQEVAFDDLSQFNDHALAAVMQAAGAQITLLALAGANAEFVNRLLRRVPAREAQIIRERIENIGPVRVRDMEAAQQEMARLAAELAQAGRIKLPVARRLALAA